MSTTRIPTIGRHSSTSARPDAGEGKPASAGLIYAADGSGKSVVLNGRHSRILHSSFSADSARVWRADVSGDPIALLRGDHARGTGVLCKYPPAPILAVVVTVEK